VWGTKRDRWNNIPFRVIPDRGKITEDFFEGSSVVDRKEAWNVFHEDVSGS
jgi:hypothetical protein